MNPREMKFLTVAAIVAAGLGLAACGGGGSSSDGGQVMVPPTPPPTTPPPMPPEPVAVTVPDAMYLDADNKPVADTYEIAAGMMETTGGVTFVCAAGGDDCEVTVAANDDGSVTVTATGGTVTASLTEAAMMQVADAKQMKADDDDAMAMMARDRAIGQAAAMTSLATFDTDDLNISNPASKATSVKVTGYQPTAMQPGMLGAFAGVSLSNTSSATVTQYLTVYTDIGKPKLVEFMEHDGDTDTKALYTVSPLPLATTAPTATQGQFAAGHFNAGNIDTTIFPVAGPASGGNVTKTFKVNAKDMPTDAANNRVKLPGSFDGGRGTYTCTPADAAAGCVVTVAPNGAYTLVAADAWTFTPNDGVMAYREDGEYLRFGWWMSEPAKSTGTYSVATFQDGMDYVPSDTAGAAVTGSADYAGNAAGRYVVGDDAGTFTANASLTAKFGNTTELGSISGTISGFQGDAGGMSDWMVELKKINLPTTGLVNDGTTGNAFASAASGPGADSSSTQYNGTIATLGDAVAYGTWSGSFYGNAKNPDTLANAENAAPLAVGGQFNAAGGGANIVGAFGARR